MSPTYKPISPTLTANPNHLSYATDFNQINNLNRDSLPRFLHLETNFPEHVCHKDVGSNGQHNNIYNNFKNYIQYFQMLHTNQIYVNKCVLCFNFYTFLKLNSSSTVDEILFDPL